MVLALLNGLVVFGVWFSVLVALANDSTSVAKPVALALLPVCAVVVWRSRRHIQQLVAGNTTATHAIKDGAVAGAALASTLFFLNWLAPSALAAGHPLDGFRATEAGDWLALLAMLGPLVALAAAVGAMHGYVLHKLNLFVLRRMNEA